MGNKGKFDPDVPPQYKDCNKNADIFFCAALAEKMCVTRGKCKFYYPRKKKEETENDENC